MTNRHPDGHICFRDDYVGSWLECGSSDEVGSGPVVNIAEVEIRWTVLPPQHRILPARRISKDAGHSHSDDQSMSECSGGAR